MLQNKPLFHKNLYLQVRTVLVSLFQVVFKVPQVIVVFEFINTCCAYIQVLLTQRISEPLLCSMC